MSHPRRFSFAQTLVVGILLEVTSGWALVKTYSVSATAGKGTHTTIQSAINDCGSNDVCTINVLDVTTTLMAPIWIENKSNITLKSATASGARATLKFDASLYTKVANPNVARGYGSGSGLAQATVYKLFTLSGQDIFGVADSSIKRPAGWLMWPYIGTANGTKLNGPVGAATDTSNPYSHFGFYFNGMIVVHKSQDVTIKGFKLTGNPYIFQNQKVWSQMYDNLFGTIGVTLKQSLRVNVDSNDIGGFFSAIFIYGRNVGGMFGNSNPSDIDGGNIVPLSRYGQVGNHNIQRNYFHDNWWCFYQESIWDLSSRIHHNIAYNNMNKSFQYSDSLTVANAATQEMNNQTGGFIYMKDQALAADRVYNNTILRSPILMGMCYWRAGSQDLFYNNVVRPTSEVSAIKSSDDHQLMQNYGQTVWDNTFELRPSCWPTTDSILDNQTVKDSTLQFIHNSYVGTCATGCNFAAKYPNIKQLQPAFPWNGNWGIREYVSDSIDGSLFKLNGTYLTAMTDSTTNSGRAVGYNKKFAISSVNAYGPWGQVNKMGTSPRAMDSTTSRPRNNLYAVTLPTILDTVKKDTSYTQATPTNVYQLAPAWDSSTVKNTILHQAWNNDNSGNLDGSSGNRGAFCYDSTTGKTTIGCTPSGVTLSLTDQQIVGISGTKVSIPLIVSQLDNSTGLSTSKYSGFKVDSVYYYHGFPWANLDSAIQNGTDQSKWPYVLPEKFTNATWDGTSGSYLTMNIGKALVDTEDVVRFEVFMSALDPSTGKRASTIGLYFYRKLDYTLKVQFCSDAACTKIINSARVDDSVYMKVTTLKTSDSSAVSQTVSSVYVSPSGGTVINLKNDSAISNQNLFLSSFTSSFTTQVKFRTAGTVGLTVTGLLGSSTSAISVLGVGTIKIRPGYPYTVQFVVPQTYQAQTCNGDPGDTANGCNEFTSSTPTRTTLLVTDKYGNAVDTAATVAVTSSPEAFRNKANGFSAIAGSSTGLGATANVSAGTNSLDVQTDSVGNAYLYAEGIPGTTGTSYYATKEFPWIGLHAVVVGTRYASYPTDSAWVRLMPSAGKLKWKSPDSVDTLINTAVPLTLIFTKDGVNAFAADTTVQVYSGNTYVKFYADSTLATPLTATTASDGSTVYQVRLSSGSIRVWVASTRAGTDSLYAKFAEATATTAIPATFTIPTTPQVESGVFKDATCDGVADSAVIHFKALGSSVLVQKLDTSAIRIDTVKFHLPSGDSLVLDSSSVRYLSGDTSFAVVFTAAQAAKFAAYDPVATVTVHAAIKGGTLVNLGGGSVTDGISPRPVSAALVIGFTSATSTDTLKVKFSEPVTYKGTAFPFLVVGKTVVGIGVAGCLNSAGGTCASADTSLSFVLSGANATTLLADGSAIAIDSGKGIADVAGNSGHYSECAGDTARVVPPSGQLVWAAPAKIDTFVNTAVAATLWLTMDGSTVDATDPAADAYVSVRATAVAGIRFYADSTMATALNADSIKLVGGAAKFWIASASATGWDSLYAAIASGASTASPLAVRFTTPPAPNAPQPDFGVFKDADCDGVADSVIVHFKALGASVAVRKLDTSKVRIDQVRFYLASGDSLVLDSTAVRVHDGDTTFAVILPAAAKASFAAYRPTSWLRVLAALVRKPADDTVVILGDGSKVAAVDGISPRPVASAIVENPTPATLADTLRVKFSEPVTYAGTSFPFLVDGKAVAGLSVTGCRNSANGPCSAADTLLTFVLTGNTANQVVAGQFLAIDSGKGVDDVAGNSGRYSECAGDTALISLQPVAVPVIAAWISDIDGDSRADRITVEFRRKFKTASEAPDSFVVANWGAVSSTTLQWIAATAVDSQTYTFAVSFAQGVTVGTNADGSGSLTLKQGAFRSETGELADSVPPVAIGAAKLTYGTGADQLVVTYSEPLKQATGAIWMGLKSPAGADAALTSFTNAKSNAAATVWTYTLPSGLVSVGDSVRMALSGSALAAVNGQLPASTGNAPYIPVVGGDRAPDSAKILDLDGDGKADAVKLYYSSTLKGNPTLSFTWGGATVKLDSVAYGKMLKGTSDTAILVLPEFATELTSGTGSGTSTSLVNDTATSPLPFKILDGIAPVLDSIHVSYGSDEGFADTLRLKLSEPLASADEANGVVDKLFLIKRTTGGTLVVHPFAGNSSSLIVVSNVGTVLTILCDSCVDGASNFGLPTFGDSARLQVGISDTLGNRVGDSSKWVPVYTGAYPVRYTAGIYPQAVHVDSGTTPEVIKVLPSVTSWVLPVSSSGGSWTAVGTTASASAATLDAATAQSGLFGVKVDLNTSFDGQFMVYDNLGVFVGKTEVALDADSLKAAGLVNSKGKYSLVVALNGTSAKGQTLASGVYMIRLIGYSRQVVNGQEQRVMIQNKLFKIGYRSKLGK